MIVFHVLPTFPFRHEKVVGFFVCFANSESNLYREGFAFGHDMAVLV